VAIVQPRPWRAIPLAVLLVLATCLLVVVGGQVLRTYQGLRNAQRLRAGEEVGVRPWMTVPYISCVYNVPDDDLFRILSLSNTEQHRHAPLQALARQEGRDLNADIAALNATIDARRATATPQRVP
jgi:hypothetical protein